MPSHRQSCGRLAPAGRVLAATWLAVAASCSQEPTPAVSFEVLLSRGDYQAVVAESERQLSAAYELGRPPAECWSIERARLVALASLGQTDELLRRWQSARTTYAAQLPSHFRLELIQRLHEVDPSVASIRRFIAEDHGLRVDDLEPVQRAGLGPYGHPEGFPRAWLAPDERPDER